jgi:hypothetical protein
MTETILPTRSRFFNAYTRVTLWAIFCIAILAGLITLVGTALELIGDLTSDRIPLNLALDKTLPAAATQCTRCAVTGTFDSANVVVKGLSGDVIGLVLVGAIGSALVAVAISILVAVLAWRLLHRGFFRRAVTNTVVGAGVVLTIGGLISKGALAMAGIQAASEIDGSGTGYWPLAADFDPAPLFFGFVLLLVASAFEYGARLQKDTEGLV